LRGFKGSAREPAGDPALDVVELFAVPIITFLSLSWYMRHLPPASAPTAVRWHARCTSTRLTRCCSRNVADAAAPCARAG